MVDKQLSVSDIIKGFPIPELLVVDSNEFPIFPVDFLTPHIPDKREYFYWDDHRGITRLKVEKGVVTIPTYQLTERSKVKIWVDFSLFIRHYECEVPHFGFIQVEYGDRTGFALLGVKEHII